jgi:glucose/mannose-6-phosphate isomerase
VTAAPGTGASFLEHDSEGMLAASAALPDHIERARAAFGGVPPTAEPPTSVVVIGMGGSGVAGAVLQAMGAGISPIPIVLSSSYGVPRFVGPDTLVFAVSFSGETEETLAAAQQALDAGARLVAITEGGTLASMVAEAGGSVLALRGGIPQPRAGLGAMITPLLLACEQIGVLPGAGEALASSVEQLRRRIPTLVGGGGVAREIARRIGRTIPLVHGAAGLGAVAAARWKTQVNENAKSPAFAGAQPEVCHNEVCGFGQNGDVTRQLLTLVELRTGDEGARIATRFGLVAEMVDEAVGAVVEVIAEGGSELARFFDLVTIGDFVSLHLAAREGVDPGPVPTLTEIKRRLATP